MNAPAITPAVGRAIHRELMRRSLGHFHAEAFAMLHNGEPLLPGPHIDAMVHVLEQVALGSIKHSLITLPPRHGKSELISGSFVAWLLGHDPSIKVTIASYGYDLSADLVALPAQIMKAPGYKQIFPKTQIKPGKDRKGLIGVFGGGLIRAASKGGAMTGLGTHILIVDDWHKAGETLSPIERANSIETFRKTYLTRFDNLADARIIIVQQRLHVDDLVGWALDNGEWHHLRLPAIAEQDEDIPLQRGQVWHRKKDDILAPPIASRKVLDAMKTIIGPRDFGAQFQQNPTVAEGSLIDLSWFGQYDERRPRSYYHRIVQSWDPAMMDGPRSDYSVGMTWGFRDGKWYLLDLIRIKVRFELLADRVKAWHQQWKADCLIIEGASIGDGLYRIMKRAKLPGKIIAPKPISSKSERLAVCAAELATGKYLFPASAPWLPDLRSELLQFPDGTHDDQVDALTQFIEFEAMNPRWVEEKRDAKGRRIRPHRHIRTPRSYADINPTEHDSNR